MVEFREFGLAQGCLDSDGADDDDGGGSSDCDRKDGRESVEFNRLWGAFMLYVNPLRYLWDCI